MGRDGLPPDHSLTFRAGSASEPGVKVTELVPVGDEAVVIAVRGGLAAGRAEDLWSSVEWALERSAGGRVLVDLTEVSGFDADSVVTLRGMLRVAARRRDDLSVWVWRHSALGYYLDHLAPAAGWRCLNAMPAPDRPVQSSAYPYFPFSLSAWRRLTGVNVG